MSGLFPRIPTSLDLNGPELSFIEQPVDAETRDGSGTVSFVGIATATFPEDQLLRNENSGYIAYRWYRNDELLTDNVNVVGAATTTLTLYGLESSDDRMNVFVRVDYVPSAYETGTTGNAYNEPLDSNTATVTVFPIFRITNQPKDLTVVENTPAVFSVDAITSNNSDSDLIYQWNLNGQPLVDDEVSIVGSRSKELRITRTTPALEKVSCTVSHPTAQPGTLTTTEAKLDTTPARVVLSYEKFSEGLDENGDEIISNNDPFYEYFNEDARTGTGNFNQKPSCIGIPNGWYTRTGSAQNRGDRDVRKLQIIWDGILIYDGPYIPNEDGYMIIGNYAYIWGEYRSPSLYGWRYDDACGVGDTNAQPFGTGDFGNGFDVTRHEYVIRTRNDNVVTGSRNLITGGHLSFRADADISARTIVVYPKEKDVDIKITMGASAGADRGNYRGGNGGISVFKMRMLKDTEYVIKLGVNSFQTGGPKGGNNGGGGLAVIYRKATVIAVCGGGGGAGINGRGGDGGGLQIAGEDGGGRNHGIGGEFFSIDNLGVAGYTQAGRTAFNEFDTGSSGGGKLGGCTLGNYWHIQGKTPCEDVGSIKFYNADGVINNDTSVLIRGYKSGQGFRNNGGAASGNQGGGGSGARGGSGALGDGAGGGGASGYASSEIELLNSLELPGGTELGGNTDTAFITFEAFLMSSENNYPPYIPPASGDAILQEKTVTWNISRSTPNENAVTFVKESGIGPTSVTWGPNSEGLTSQISKDAVYVFSSSTSSTGQELVRRLDGNTLKIEDSDDNDFDDLTITPSDGKFTSDSRWVADW